MPFDPSLGQSQSLLGNVLGSVPIVGGLLSGVAQMFTNSSNRRYQTRMYERQRQDALSDWNMQNAYNSPEAQMARLKAANLNPNLVYGQGATATASGQPRAAQATQGTAQSPDFNVSPQSLFAGVDLQTRHANLDNLKATNAAIISEIARKNASTASIMQATAKSAYDLQFAKDTRDTSISIMNEQLHKLTTGIDISLQANERAIAQNAASLQEAATRILKMRQETSNSYLDRQRIQAQIRDINSSARIKEMDAMLKSNGVQPGDNIFFRMLSETLGEMSKNLSEGYKNFRRGILDFKK